LQGTEFIRTFVISKLNDIIHLKISISMEKQNFDELTIDELWQLRNEVTLNSIYVPHFKNSFGFDARDVAYFFEGYVDYLQELAEEQNEGDLPTIEIIEKYDFKENLWSWFNCFDDLSWIKYVGNDTINTILGIPLT
jgi:hypothetical protein